MIYKDPIEAFVERMYWTIYDPEAIKGIQQPLDGTSNWLQEELKETRGRQVAIAATLRREIDEGTITDMSSAGVDIFRLNFAHGKLDRKERFEEYKKLISLIRGSRTHNFKILGDLAGPKIRIGRVGDPSLGLPEVVKLEKDKSLQIQIISEDDIDTKIGTSERVYTSYQSFIQDLIIDPTSGKVRDPKGLRIILGDGEITLEITELDKEKGVIKTTITQGGDLSSNAGITIPGVTFSAPALRKTDIENLVLALLEKLDLVGISFVKKPEEIQAARYIIEQFPTLLEKLNISDKDELITHAKKVKIVAKIELQQAVKQLDSILDWVDGVMVARGDLALNTSWPELPTLEREILQKAQQRGKFTIVATQLLYTLCDRMFPARSEIFDTYYAIHAICQPPAACMLSEETAKGAYPIRAVKTLDSLIKASLAIGPPLRRRDKALRKNPLVRQLNSGRDVAIIASLVLSQELLREPRESKKFLDKLVASGVDVFRMNLSIGSWEKHKEIIEIIHEYRDVKILVDFQGPKMMIGLIGEDFEHGPEAWLREGSTFTLTKESISGDATAVQVKPPSDQEAPHYIDQIIKFYKNQGQGQPPIILGDRDVILRVKHLEDPDPQDPNKGKIITSAEIDGRIYPGMGITVPGFTPDPLLSKREKELLRNAVQAGADMVAISFVRDAQDVEDVWREVEEAARGANRNAEDILLVPKIESKEGLDNLHAILECKHTSGIMVSRGDLYLALQGRNPNDLQSLARSLIEAQNKVISQAKEKFSIVATGMLSHMVSHRLPLRSEPIDIFYAVECGCSACLLLTETTAGGYAVEAVKTLDQIIRQVY